MSVGLNVSLLMHVSVLTGVDDKHEGGIVAIKTLNAGETVEPGSESERHLSWGGQGGDETRPRAIRTTGCTQTQPEILSSSYPGETNFFDFRISTDSWLSSHELQKRSTKWLITVQYIGSGIMFHAELLDAYDTGRYK